MECQLAEETVQAFFGAWFVRRSAREAISFLSEDVSISGIEENEVAQGKAVMAEYLKQYIQKTPEPYEMKCTVLHKQPVTENVCNLVLHLTLRNAGNSWRLHGFFTLVQDQTAKWVICGLHLAEPRDRQQRALLNESLPGGMMGGYIEPGFPFYYINPQMLDYLGYENEEDFVSDTSGMISNCMHPDDSAMVDRDVARQLKSADGYIVEYRMRKKNGSYIWVHDVGRRITAEDGRPAILSVCIDVTGQKQAQEEILHLYNSIPGAVFRCRFDEGLSVIDANDGLFEFLGYTREEFAAMGSRMSAVFSPESFSSMLQQLNRQLAHGCTAHSESRVICKDGKEKWISMKAHFFPEPNGERYLSCIFVDITDEKRLQERVRELYEKELSYFAELSSSGGSIQGRLNVTQNRLESYLSTADVAVALVGDTYEKTVENLASSAADPVYGEDIRRTLSREKVLADYASRKVDYHFEFLRRRNDGSVFWGSTNMRAYLNPESGDVILFFYTLEEQL